MARLYPRLHILDQERRYKHSSLLRCVINYSRKEGVTTLSSTTFNITKLKIKGLYVTHRQHKWHLAKSTLSITLLCHYANFCILFIIMLNVIVLDVIMLNVIMLNVIMLNVIMLSVIMLNVIMLNVIMQVFLCWAWCFKE